MSRALFPEMDLGEPMEVVAKQGDVLFFHHLLPHSGTMNVGAARTFRNSVYVFMSRMP